MSSNRALEDNDVSDVLQRVRVALSRAERVKRKGPIVVEPVRPDAYGISRVRQRSELLVDVASGSARPVVGPAITFGKRVFRRLVRWYAKPVAVQQTLLNGELLDVSERIGQAVSRLQRQLGEFSLRLDDVERGLDALESMPGGSENGTVAAAQPAVRGEARAAEPAALSPHVQRVLSYSGFEDRHRGSEEVVRPLLEPYLAHFAGCELVVDLGCGRGEFVDLLTGRGIEAYGVDSDASQVAAAQAAGRDVRLEDAVAHLRSMEQGTIDGAFSSQVAEHLTTDQLMTQIELVHRKLAPGGVFVMETPNPEALFIFATFFYVDLTHLKPIHPEALRWAFEVCGFHDVVVQRSQRVPDTARLAPVPAELAGQPGWDVLNRNTSMLNDLIYGYQHYAVVGRKAEVVE